MSKLISLASLLGALAYVSSVSAHGVVSGIVANGKYYPGYTPSMQFQNPPPVVVGWSIPEDLDTGFVAPDAFANPDIICHKGATPGGAHATVTAGSKVQLEWTTWPVSHHGPVIDYLASCNGPCEKTDKTKLEFFKIDGAGLVDGSTPPGSWASDDLIANNNTWSVTIPSSIAPGNYVLRHEIIALHSAENANGAQNYPQCINLEVTGSGTAKPSGVLGTALYKATDPGILVNIYQALSKYVVPGPAVFSGAASPSTGNATGSSASGSSTASASAVETSASAPKTSTQARATTSPDTTSPSTLPTPPSPEGLTLKEFLAWIDEVITTYVEGQGQQQQKQPLRRHARDILSK
ncbi:MAG: hypothetical protein M4579_002562 [Chaenotheca gracillima]|nr:MAG: hypothetical protein M4579_002562 [Chaenotheca gracillima]